MFIVFFLLWIVFNGRWTTEIALFGVVISAAIYAFCCAFMGYSPKKDWNALKKAGYFVRYLAELMKEIYEANVYVLHYILSSRHENEPVLLTFRTKLKSDVLRTMLANSITLTPGTITADVKEDVFTVHCLDKELGEGLEDSEFEKILLEMERENP